MSTMRSLTGGSASLPDAFGQTGSRFGKSCSVPGEPLLAYLLGDCAPKAIAAKFGREKYHKRSENIGDNACGEGAVAWVDPTACPTEIQQKRTCLRIPAQSLKQEAEPVFREHVSDVARTSGGGAALPPRAGGN